MIARNAIGKEFMPRFDGTGPEGLGPRTGRGLGPCDFGVARGFGRMRRFGLSYPLSRRKSSDKEQLAGLEDYKKVLLEEIDLLESQIEDLKKNQ